MLFAELVILCVFVCMKEQERKRAAGGIWCHPLCGSLIGRAEPRILILCIALGCDKSSCSSHLPHQLLQSTNTHRHTRAVQTMHHLGICPFKDELHSLSCLVCLSFRLTSSHTRTHTIYKLNQLLCDEIQGSSPLLPRIQKN